MILHEKYRVRPSTGSLIISGIIIYLIVSQCLYADTRVRVACVGNSITYGAAIDDRSLNSYPAVLERLLGEDYDVHNFGVSGATLLRTGALPYRDTAEFSEATRFKADIVIIKLGTNDTRMGNWTGADEFERDFKEMIEHFAGLPGKPDIFVCHPVPIHGIWRIANDRRLRKEIIPAITRAAREKNIQIIDLYTPFKDLSGHFPDGVHPNADGARIIAETVYKAIRSSE